MDTETKSRELRREQVQAFNLWRSLCQSETATEASKDAAEFALIRANREARDDAAWKLDEAQANHADALERGDDEEFQWSRREVQDAEDHYRQVESFLRLYDEAADKYAGVKA